MRQREPLELEVELDKLLENKLQITNLDFVHFLDEDLREKQTPA